MHPWVSITLFCGLLALMAYYAASRVTVEAEQRDMMILKWGDR